MNSKCFINLIRNFKSSCYEDKKCLQQNNDAFEMSLILILKNHDEIYKDIIKNIDTYELYVRDKFLQAAVRAKDSYILVKDLSELSNGFNGDRLILNSARKTEYIHSRDFSRLSINKYSYNTKAYEANLINCDLLWAGFSTIGSNKAFSKLFWHIESTPKIVRKIYAMYEEKNPLEKDYKYFVGAINFNDRDETIGKIVEFVDNQEIERMISKSRNLNKISIVLYIYALKRMNANIKEFSYIAEKVKKMYEISS